MFRLFPAALWQGKKALNFGLSENFRPKMQILGLQNSTFGYLCLLVLSTDAVLESGWLWLPHSTRVFIFVTRAQSQTLITRTQKTILDILRFNSLGNYCLFYRCNMYLCLRYLESGSRLESLFS